MTNTVAQEIASRAGALKRCVERGNPEWARQHRETLRDIERNYLPSGAGVDNGTTIDLDRTSEDKIVLTCSYHHMNNDGYYDGWTDHTITVRPTFRGFHVDASGDDRDDILAYLGDLYREGLSQPISKETR